MKRILAALLISTIFAASGCVNETRYGNCVGLLEEKDPALVYNASVQNIVLAVVFSETIIVPIVVALDGIECPTAKKPAELK